MMHGDLNTARLELTKDRFNVSNHRDDCDNAGFALGDSSNRRAKVSENGRNSQKVALIEIQEMIASCGFALK